MSPTTAATQRCRTCAAVASVTAGNSVPPISGQSGKTSADAGRRHVRPEQQQRERRAVANAASSVNRWLAPRPPIRAG